jgi:chemotaxis protein histidine kinase CheA
MQRDDISIEAQEVLEHLRQEFLSNLPEHVHSLENKALELEKSPIATRKQHMEDLARDIHSLKGAGSVFGYATITAVCHQFEDHLRRVSPHSLAGRIDHFLRYVDLLRDVCSTLHSDGTDFSAHQETLHTLLIWEQQENLRVLIADPSNSAARAYSTLISHLPVTITIENDGLAALGRIMHEPWDVVITSAEVPTLNGPALTAAMKLAGPRTRAIYTLLITSDQSLRLEGEHAPDAIVHKTPQGQAKLRTLIEQRIAQKSART